MNILVFNLKHGANLGDQLISECLAKELAVAAPGAAIETLDLGGRVAPPTDTRRRWVRGAVMATLRHMPVPLRRRVTSAALGRVTGRLREQWRARLGGYDAVVVGGGGIFADQDLNFPSKIAAAVDTATEAGRPVAVYAVGVSRGWSKQGTGLFGGALSKARLCHASVRDEGARGAWEAQLGGFGIKAPLLALDPALTAASHYDVEAEIVRSNRIGLCLTSPAALAYHMPAGTAPRRIGDWYAATAFALIDRGYEVTAFTTGATEDAAFAAAFARRVKARNLPQMQVIGPLSTPAALLCLINRCALVIGHRLHAMIAAYALGVPGLALAWEPKMVDQMGVLGYPERLVDPATTPPEAIAVLAAAIIAQGLDPVRREDLVRRAKEDVASLAGTLRRTLAADG